VNAARDRGYEYIAITDHSKRVTVAGGLDDDALRSHADDVRRLNDSVDDIWVLAGVEVDILRDGALDIDAGLLAELDWVLASIHYDRALDEKAMTARLVAAIESGLVHCLGHPTGRIIGAREQIPFNFDRVFEACRKNDVCVEINAQPDRLDLSDVHARAAKEAGLILTVSTDAHSTATLDYMKYGVSVARRAGLEKGDILNTLPLKEFRERVARS
jgi:DNA polymerase (family 10)